MSLGCQLFFYTVFLRTLEVICTSVLGDQVCSALKSCNPGSRTCFATFLQNSKSGFCCKAGDAAGGGGGASGGGRRWRRLPPVG